MRGVRHQDHRRGPGALPGPLVRRGRGGDHRGPRGYVGLLSSSSSSFLFLHPPTSSFSSPPTHPPIHTRRELPLDRGPSDQQKSRQRCLCLCLRPGRGREEVRLSHPPTHPPIPPIKPHLFSNQPKPSTHSAGFIMDPTDLPLSGQRELGQVPAEALVSVQTTHPPTHPPNVLVNKEGEKNHSSTHLPTHLFTVSPACVSPWQ